MVLPYTIETDGRRPHNRNRWPHNSRATVFCHAWPILVFAVVAAFYPLLPYWTGMQTTSQAHSQMINQYCTSAALVGLADGHSQARLIGPTHGHPHGLIIESQTTSSNGQRKEPSLACRAITALSFAMFNLRVSSRGCLHPCPTWRR